MNWEGPDISFGRPCVSSRKDPHRAMLPGRKDPHRAMLPGRKEVSLHEFRWLQSQVAEMALPMAEEDLEDLATKNDIQKVVAMVEE